ncbi:MAG: hypothetical protein IPG64_16975 [Haliea sp.]|nr:hypothetical protein [Haliea sp.]
MTTAVDIDTAAPAAPTVSVPEAAGGINATEAADGVPVLVTLPAGAVAGDVITVSIDGSTPITHTVTAAEAAAPPHRSPCCCPPQTSRRPVKVLPPSPPPTLMPLATPRRR